MAALSKPEGTDALGPSAALEAQEYLQARLAKPTTTKSFTAIPVIDLTPSFSSSFEARQSVALEINKACTEVGFFYITGHGIAKEVCDDVLKLAARFFHELSPTAKDALHIRNSAHFRGYEPAEASQVNAFTAKETKEAFNWGYETGLDPNGGDGQYVELDGSQHGKTNVWPEEADLPGFYDGIGRYYGQVEVSQELLSTRLTHRRQYDLRGISSIFLQYLWRFQKTTSTL